MWQQEILISTIKCEYRSQIIVLIKSPALRMYFHCAIGNNDGTVVRAHNRELVDPVILPIEMIEHGHIRVNDKPELTQRLMPIRARS
jgi:hypothetical protein